MTIQEFLPCEIINRFYENKLLLEILSESTNRYDAQTKGVHDHKQNFLNYYKKDIEILELRKTLTEIIKNW